MRPALRYYGGQSMNFPELFFKVPKMSMGKIEYIIAGLGNPGNKYKNTRHNAGFISIDYISKKNNINIDFEKFNGLCGTGNICQKKVLLLKPLTFMNQSGCAVFQAMSFYKVPPQNVIILFDDISLLAGKIRIRKSGSHGGHNGMRNIIDVCGTDIFPRIKIGIGGKPTPEWDLADWVLSEFSPDDLCLIMDAAKMVENAIHLIIEGKADKAMNKFN